MRRTKLRWFKLGRVLKNATGGEVGVILPQAPQSPLAVGADPSLPRSTLVHRILP